jgi:hypothetical protein
VERPVATPPEPPSWERTITATLAGLAIGAVALLIAVLILWMLSLAEPFDDGHDVFGWPLPVVDGWSLLADVARLSIACALLTLGLQAAVHRIVPGWTLRRGPIALTIAFAWIPFPGSATIVSIALIAVAVRAFGLAPAPSPRWSIRHRALAGLAVTPALLLGLAYQPLHPLVIESDVLAFFGDTTAVRLEASRRSSRSLSFLVLNDGPSDVTLQSIRPRPPVGEDWLAGNAEALFVASGQQIIDPSSGYEKAQPIAGTTLAPGEDRFVTIELRADACRGQQRRLVQVAHVEARLKTLGIERTQRFDVEPEIDIHCGGVRAAQS